MSSGEVNYINIKRILDSLKETLGPHVQSAVEDLRSTQEYSPEMRNEIDGMIDGRPWEEIDIYSYLRLFTRLQLTAVHIDKMASCYAHEMIAHRNRWAHDYSFSSEDVDRIQDTEKRLSEMLRQQREKSQPSPHPAESDGTGIFRDPGDSENGRQKRREREPQHSQWGEREMPVVFEPGQRYEGTVVGITNHGFMLNIGLNKYYLMHKKNLMGVHKGQGGVGSLYRLNEKLDVEVIAVDHLGRPDLEPLHPKSLDDGEGEVQHDDGYGQQPPMPWSGESDSRQGGGMPPMVGEILNGKIKGVYPHGASVYLSEGWSGYLHISNISKDFVRDVSDYVNVGEELKLRVLRIDMNRKRVDLGLKQLGD